MGSSEQWHTLTKDPKGEIVISMGPDKAQYTLVNLEFQPISITVSGYFLAEVIINQLLRLEAGDQIALVHSENDPNKVVNVLIKRKGRE